MPILQRQWIYRRAPQTEVGPEHYELVSHELDPTLAAGHVLLETLYVSVDPYMRINQAVGRTWQDPHPIDTVQSGGTILKVIASRDPALNPGDIVLGYTGWQTHAKVPGSTVTRLDPDEAPVTAALGVLGMPGRTAWFGLTEVGKPKAGETVVVSGASGAVGSLVVQFAKRQGCRVIAITGGPQKQAFLTHRLGADAALDYRTYASAAQLQVALQQLTDGVDVYFDNVGGWITDAVLGHLALRARVIICGQISQYSGGLDTPDLGPRFLHHVLYQRATIQGILARDYAARMDEMRRIVGPWVKSGELHFEETIIDGFDQLPAALNRLFTGTHTGKLLVKA